MKRSVVLLGLMPAFVLLVSATHSQGQRSDRFSTVPTISALPQSVNAPPDNPHHRRQDRAGQAVVLGSHPVGEQGCGLRDMSSSSQRVCRGPRPLHRRERCRLREESPVPAAQFDPVRQAKQPDHGQCRLQRHQPGRRVQSRERADVLGHSREEPGDPGARADQVVRGDARRRLYRRRGARDGRGPIECDPRIPRAVQQGLRGRETRSQRPISARRLPRSADRLFQTTRPSTATCAAIAAR